MLKNEELLEVKGGVNWTLIGIGGAVISFIIGVIDGLTRPLKCNK